MKKTDSQKSTRYDDQLTLVARLYYVDGLGQTEVARLANVSQAKVSRLLAQAKDRGIVRISVAGYEPRHVELEERLRRRLGLSQTIVIKSYENADEASLRKTVGYFGGPILLSLLNSDDVAAIAGGRTIRETVQHLPEDPSLTLKLIQAMGHVGSDISEFDAQEVGRLMARRLGGSFIPLNAPAFIPDKQARDVILELEQVRSVRRSLRNARVAIVGIGTLENSVFVERGALTGEMIRELRAADAVGEICGRFFNAAGKECATPWADRVVSISMDDLRRIPLVLVVASGSDRSAALHAATQGGLIKGLLIDEGGARSLLDYADAIPASRASASRPARRGKEVSR